MAITQLLIAFAHDVWLILALRFLQGAFAGYIAPAQAYSVEITDGRNRTRLFACLQVATNVGSLVGAFLGGLILDAASFSDINLIAGIVCGLCTLIAWLMLPVPRNQRVPTGISQIQTRESITAKHPLISGLFWLTSMLLASRMVLQVPFALYMMQVFGARHWMVGFCYGLLALGFVIGAPLWARFLKDSAKMNILGWMIIISASCALVSTVAGLTTSISIFAFIYLVWGALLGGTTPVLLALISTLTPVDRQGSVLGLAQSCQQAASIAGIAVGVGAMQFLGLQTVFPLVSTLYTLSLFLALALWFKSRKALKEGIRL
ncbi:MFS family permease [Phyllobacterium myrsinacearum]|uniref:MFS family permease n=1 Tax=Phyllobacterium myrsinacearum TaxID=28101 RepID=A0A839EV76_9HYPH|nr:MFS family permease [Phyllobacterium myrsinacearum]